MADIRNDISELQSKVYGQPVHSPEDFPAPPDSWRDTQDSGDSGSGDEYKDPPPQTGRGSRKGRKRKPTRDRTN